MLQEGLVARLGNDAGVEAICAGRVFAIEAPADDAQYPCVVYRLVGGAADNQTFETPGMMRQRIELDALSENADEAARLRFAVTCAAITWAKDLLSDGTNIDSCALLNPGTDFETGPTRFFRCSCEVYVLFTFPL
jgi:Protein of unknown function (DUF3168)